MPLSYARIDESLILKLEGYVRADLCGMLDNFWQTVFKAPRFSRLVFDLSACEGLDSTALGMMAKGALLSEEHGQLTPIIAGSSSGMVRLLKTMGFDKLFVIMSENGADLASVQRLPDVTCSKSQMTETVLDAHRLLMDMNKQNQDRFRDLVEGLEQESSSGPH